MLMAMFPVMPEFPTGMDMLQQWLGPKLGFSYKGEEDMDVDRSFSSWSQLYLEKNRARSF